MAEGERWWEQEQIVVWFTIGPAKFERLKQFVDLSEGLKGLYGLGCGNTPEEAVDFFRAKAWVEVEKLKELQKTQKRWTGSARARQRYMEMVQARLPLAEAETFVFVDAESFLHEMVKIGAMKIEKWEWEPE